MRMRWEPEAEEEFEAARGLLVDRLVRWAGEQGPPVDGYMAETALDYRHLATRPADRALRTPAARLGRARKRGRPAAGGGRGRSR
ncbi:hypothetical protein [Streptomyces sp. NPDC058991]|uniref:hypothetical protein n=1 Tax=unclassified Streptomyces TaxID=2593676 RepID=UPI0036B69E59